jgi:hypothetical protein
MPADRPSVLARTLPLTLIVALAVGLRLLAWHNAVQIANDGTDFLWQAQRLLDGDIGAALDHPYHPLYAAATALVAPLAGNLLTAAVAVSIASGVLIVMAVWGLARLALPDRIDIAVATALLAACHDRTLLLTSDVMADGLFLALLLLALLLLFRAEQSVQVRWPLLPVGLLAGASYLTRPEGLFVALVVVLWLLAGLTRRSARRGRPLPSRGRYLAGGGLFLAGLAICVLPYAWRIHERTGSWNLSLKPSLSMLGLAESLPPTIPRDCPIASPRIGPSTPGDQPEEERQEAGSPDPSPAPAEEADAPPGEFLERLKVSALETTLTFFRALRYDLLMLALIGLPVFLRRRPGLLVMLLLVVGGWLGMATLQLHVNGYLSRRYLLAPALLVVPLSGSGLVTLWRGLQKSGTVTFFLRVLVVLIVVALTASGARKRHTNHWPRVWALSWVSAQTDGDERIGVPRRKDGWYADRPVMVLSTPIPDERLLAAMERHDVRLLVLDVERVEREAPHWLEGGPFDERVRFGDGAQAVVVLERRP